MEFFIQENVAIKAPKLSDSFVEESRAAASRSGSKRLIAEIAAIHEGITSNYNKYTEIELSRATESWMLPYPKPILVNHDINSDPLGRIVEATMDRDPEGAYIKLRASITNPDTIARITDGRYITGSVGGRPEAAYCSICRSDVVADAREGNFCGHSRGSVYEGQTCVYEHRNIKFYEYSFVNAPGDSHSQILAHGTKESALSIYSVDMSNQTIERYDPDMGFVDMRETLSEKDAFSLYLEMAFGAKGASAFDAEISQIVRNINSKPNASTITLAHENSDQEDSNMSDEIKTDEEDILKIADSLKDSLESSEADEAEDNASDSPEVSEEETSVEDEEKVEETEQEEEVKAEEEEVVEETTSEEASEDNADASEEDTTEPIDVSEETEEVAEEATETEEPVAEEEEQKAEEAEAEESETTDNASNDSEVPVESDEKDQRIAALEEENAALKADVTAMKEALHKELASRVVEARIAVGFIDPTDREVELEEHIKRSSSSLADALIDTHKYAQSNNFESKVTEGVVPGLEIKAQAISQENAPVEGDEEEIEVEDVKEAKPEDIFVNEFSKLLSMGTEKYKLSKQS